MNISVDPRSRFYRPEMMGSRVFIEGEEVTHVIFVSDHRGFAVRHKIGADGFPMIEGDRFVFECVRGTVRIESPAE